MKTKSLTLFVLMLFALFIMPLVSADLIKPGYRGISINNYITNINDFSEYVFISTGALGGGPGLGMCPVKVIEEDSTISSYYKACSISVYAIKKSDFNLEDVQKMNETQIKGYLSSPKVKEVIRDISSYTEVPITSPKASIDNYYTIDLEKIIEKPTSVIKNNSLFYVYLACSALALLITIFVIAKKRAKKVKK